MHIGLIGGIGPAATDTYYRGLVRAMAARKAALEMTIVHADAPTLISHLMQDDAAAQVAIYERVTARLAAAGAQCVAVTSMAGHFCRAAFAEVSPLPVVDMVEVVAAHVAREGYERLGVLGTAPVMRSGLYGGLGQSAILPPRGALFDQVHEAYVAMASSGVATPDQRAVFDQAIAEAFERQNVDAIIMGGTDLSLIYKPETSDFAMVDCALLHIDALVEIACQ